MAALTETKKLTIPAGETVNLRTAFGFMLDNGTYTISNNGPNLAYGAIAVAEANLPSQGHALIPKGPHWEGDLDTRDIFLWCDGESGSCNVAISPAE